MVNVTDINEFEQVTRDESMDPFDQIFAQQRKLMLTYDQIERKNGLLQTDEVPVNIHSHLGQARLKDFAWRVSEELGEAMECYEESVRHFREEVADAFHFLVELNILSGLSPDDIVLHNEEGNKLERSFPNVPADYMPALGSASYAWRIIENLAKAMNCLKNKPWKQTHMLTDTGLYRGHLLAANVSFFRFCAINQITAELLFATYFEKSAVNQFRQRSNY